MKLKALKDHGYLPHADTADANFYELIRNSIKKSPEVDYPSRD
jgi:hypothetical protein